MNWFGSLHRRFVHEGRADRLSSHFAGLLPPNASVLDVGCGDGQVASLVQARRPDVRIQGIDVHVRANTSIPVRRFDGKSIPFENKSFDVVMFVDVLHHTQDPLILLREAARVSRNIVLLKDHNDEGLLSNLTLRLMDWVGNKPHGVSLPYNYWKIAAWDSAFAKLGLETTGRIENLGLYPALIDAVCGRRLHFVASLAVPLASAEERESTHI